MNSFAKTTFLTILAVSLLLVSVFPVSAQFIPVTASGSTTESNDVLKYPDLASFIETVKNGNKKTITGLYVAGVIAAPVVQQPSDKPGFVSTEEGKLTEFRMARQYGSRAMLAHNYLEGSQFFDLKVDQIVSIVRGDGSTESYRIVDIQKYQALSPNSPYSNFVDLAHPEKEQLSVVDLFNNIYAVKDRLILQTCIEAEGEPSWGRLFVIAVPVDLDPS